MKIKQRGSTDTYNECRGQIEGHWMYRVRVVCCYPGPRFHTSTGLDSNSPCSSSELATQPPRPRRLTDGIHVEDVETFRARRSTIFMPQTHRPHRPALVGDYPATPALISTKSIGHSNAALFPNSRSAELPRFRASARIESPPPSHSIHSPLPYLQPLHLRQHLQRKAAYGQSITLGPFPHQGDDGSPPGAATARSGARVAGWANDA
jgi:hypothetical protein